MAGFWSGLPTDRVVRLVGADYEAISSCLDPLPETAPAVVTYFQHAEAFQYAEPITSTVVEAILRELTTVAVELFPQWLPAASAIDGASRLGIAAARTVAHETAATSGHFGPFLADLAECGVSRSAAGLARFSPETRAAGLIRVLKASYVRSGAAILIPVPEGLSEVRQRALLSASEWMAQHGHVGIWLVGSLDADERIGSITVVPPGRPIGTDPPEGLNPPTGPVVFYPPIAGRPHPGSDAEQRLEAALEKRAWATGRVWNRPYQCHTLVNPVRLDLWWRDEHLVVEIDGPEHRGKWRFAEDRRRDRMLHNDGITVLRFTNADVLDDLDAVLAAIEQYLHIRRAKQWEPIHHGKEHRVHPQPAHGHAGLNGRGERPDQQRAQRDDRIQPHRQAEQGAQ